VAHQNTVLHDLVKHLPWGRFAELVEHHKADARVDLSSKSHLIALLYAQLAGADSLRAIVEATHSHAAPLYHLGANPVKRSTLADANRYRPAALFSELLGALIAQAHRGLRRDLADSVRLIDSTSLRLTSFSAAWARFSAEVCGAKLHVVYDPDAALPVYTAVSAGTLNDITAAKAMPIEAGATYVFDLGYYDYAWWAKLHQAGCRIVTRFKTNTPLREGEARPVPAHGPILSDRVGFLPARQARNRKTPFQAPVREVRVRLDTGKVLRVLSNDLSASAEEIAELYKRRWAIELFFRWVKQRLKIRKFLGTSENAVRIQIAVALIAYVLLRLAHAAQAAVPSPLAFVRLTAGSLMQRRRIDELLPAPRKPRRDPDQFELPGIAA
jgi:hypothetical protein